MKGFRAQQLNLPPFDFRLGGSTEQPQIFDVLRRRFVALTPEEWVRQHFVHFLTDHLGYPSALMANEVALHVGDKQLRADTVLYGRDMQPRMIVEYKAPEIRITQKVFEQISVYNRILRVPYLIVSNGLEHFCLHLDTSQNKYTFLAEIPPFSSLQ